jgi:hypothetical protein
MMELIATATVGAGGSQVAFAGIPQTFTDLLILVNARGSRTSINDDLLIRMNSDSGNNYITKFLLGLSANSTQGGDLSTSFGAPGYSSVPAANASANIFGNCSIYLANYSGSITKRWSAQSMSENDDTNSAQSITSGVWSSTAAINRIDLFLGFTVMNQGSIVSLYGITKGSGGASVA